jgi:hypothetical protein
MSLHNLNTSNKQWLMYLNTLSSISGDDLTIKPDTRRNLLLEVSGNNNIFIKKGDTSYNLTNLITSTTTSTTDASFSNVDVSQNLNPLISTLAQATGGNNITIAYGYIIHSFTTTGSHTFTPPWSGNVEVLVVGGGGGGGGRLGGGGGGGGVIYMPSVSVVADTSYLVVVGAGGPAFTDGSNSSCFGAIAAGGGSSGIHGYTLSEGNGRPGGSGGGGSAAQVLLYQGGESSGNSLGPNSGFIYGNRGGNMATGRTGSQTRAAGGGGAGGQGIDTDPNILGNTGQTGASSGGIGIINNILGQGYYWGGGGGGGAYINQTGGWGGLGGGGGGGGNGGAGTGGGLALNVGANGSGLNGGNGGANTGGGGGGCGWASDVGGRGGSGIVVIRYLIRDTRTSGNLISLGLPSKVWGNAYIRDISVTNISVTGNMTVSGTISNVIQIIPRLANDISSSLGSTTNIWQRAFIRDLSNISTINGRTWPITVVPTGPTGPTGPPGPTGPTGAVRIGAIGPAGTTITGSWRDISNLTLTTYHRIYQEISGDISWNAVNGYYGLAKDAYPSLDPSSNGDLAVRTWTIRTAASSDFVSVCWSPELRLFVAVATSGNTRVITSSNGINWNSVTNYVEPIGMRSICWSPERRMFLGVGYGGGFAPEGGRYAFLRSTDGINWNAFGWNNISIWSSVCWSPELSLFVIVADGGNYSSAYSFDGLNWTLGDPQVYKFWTSVCWSAQLRIFVAVSRVMGETSSIMYSSNGINWNIVNVNTDSWYSVCWSPQLGLFVAVAGYSTNGVMTSQDGINWTIRTAAEINIWQSVCWSPQLELFVAVAINGTNRVMTSPNGINWTSRSAPTTIAGRSICWAPELGIFAVVSAYTTNKVMTSSLKGQPPTSYNVFDSSFNRIDETGKWDFSNINVTYLNVNNVSVNSDDRLKHNEIVITNGLDVIDRLTPKFYQKTQVLLDTSYNGDLNGYAWSHEAGLIAQEVLQISDLSFVVGGGDYYEQKYNLITQTQDVSANYYEPSANYYELSNNYYDQSANNYEVSYNLITQAYNLNYNSVFVYGLAAIKELHTKVKAQESTILNQKNIISSLLARIQALEK